MESMEKLRELVEQDKNESQTQINVTPNVFKNEITAINEIKQNETDKLVEDVFKQAVVHSVQTDTNLQDKMVDTAKKYTETKMNIIKNKVDKEDKKANVENNVSACNCFGYEEDDTDKWAVSYMKAWHTIMNAIWITIGWVTYAPITFIAKKVTVIFKKTWIAVLIALILYFGSILSPILIQWIINRF